MKYKLIRRSIPFQGRVFTVVVDDVEYESGNPTIREVAEHGGGAVILARFPDGTILLVHQHRYPFDRFLWELPAGKLNTGEDPLHCAQRELEEETGYLADSWEKLSAICTTPGFCSEVLHLYMATGLREAPGGRKLEEGELSMTMRRLPMSEALSMIERGEIVDAKTICGLLIAAHRADASARGRDFRLDIRRCIDATCDGHLSETSHYERNNWVTAELQCGRCGRKFVVKAEA